MVKRLLWCVAAAWVTIIWFSQPVQASTPMTQQPLMVIEWLKFRVDPTLRDRYLAIDDQIWTTALATYPGFLDKTTWLEPGRDDEVIFVISWATRQQWKAIPEDELEEINQRFDTALGFDYEMLESKEYVVPVSQDKGD
ncbi:MAG: TIGR03792 family protein [Cyanobacteria bacterium P01_D01_bin.156]